MTVELYEGCFGVTRGGKGVSREMKGPVKDKLKRFGLFEKLGAQTFFPTVGAAVGAYLKAHPVDWVDWEDRQAR